VGCELGERCPCSVRGFTAASAEGNWRMSGPTSVARCRHRSVPRAARMTWRLPFRDKKMEGVATLSFVSRCAVLGDGRTHKAAEYCGSQAGDVGPHGRSFKGRHQGI
jgi:hypothetical protein